MWDFWTADCKILMCCLKPQVYTYLVQHHRKLMLSITVNPTKVQNMNVWNDQPQLQETHGMRMWAGRKEEW